MDIELKPIGEIKPYERNPRVNDPVVGHARWKPAKQLGMKKVPVSITAHQPGETGAERLTTMPIRGVGVARLGERPRS